jgi:hypothetical protein
MTTLSQKLVALVRTILRRPLKAPKAPNKDHYYKPYWAKRS